MTPAYAIYDAGVPSGDNMLGDYLRARRAQVRPDRVGLPDTRSRRVPGLRRAEVALLAGISPDYYLRLEQGRDRHPSPQILEALARVLGLDPASAAYLQSLPESSRSLRGPRPRRHTVPSGIRMLLASLPLPAFVEDPYFEVLDANPLATALSPRLVAGRNRVRDVFLDPDEHALYPDWDDTTARLVAGLRRSVGRDPHNPAFGELVGQLSTESDRFRALWARHDVEPQQDWPLVVSHPVVGSLKLHRETLFIGDSVGSLVLVIYHAEPGSDSDDKLRSLGPLPSARERANGDEPEGGAIPSRS